MREIRGHSYRSHSPSSDVLQTEVTGKQPRSFDMFAQELRPSVQERAWFQLQPKEARRSRSAMLRVFMTGGSGFVGRNLIRMLTARDVEVRALARSSAAAKVVHNAGAKAIIGDLGDDGALRAGMVGCDVVFHAAAYIVQAVRSGNFMWIEGGHYPTSTCHVSNVCEGMILAAERGRGGEIYFLTDGEPTDFHSFIKALLHIQAVNPGNRSVPRWLAQIVAVVSERAWSLFNLQGTPPITQTALALIGEEVTVKDAKARCELGYTGAVSREEGFLAMASAHNKEVAFV